MQVTYNDGMSEVQEFDSDDEMMDSLVDYRSDPDFDEAKLTRVGEDEEEPNFHKPGSLKVLADGTVYQVGDHGEWRKMGKLSQEEMKQAMEQFG